jgi:predicted transcriptional regulator
LGKNRDRLAIVATILQIANSGSNKTRIMFGANLSFKLLEKYLALVVDAGFVRVEGSLFSLTEHGHDFLKRYNEYNKNFIGAHKLLEDLECEYNELDLMCNPNPSPREPTKKTLTKESPGNFEK